MPVLRVPTQYAMSTARESSSRESKSSCEIVVSLESLDLAKAGRAPARRYKVLKMRICSRKFKKGGAHSARFTAK